jgi:hypothetical protein
MTSLTDRYVHVTVRLLDDTQRGDVEQELRGTIADMVDARLDAGAAGSRDEAERAVLTELGDPVRLAAGYSGRPLHLIGPAVYPEWRRLVTVLLSTVVPLAATAHLLVRLLTDAVDTEGIGPVAASTAGVAMTTALHVAFWTTLAFAVVERSGASLGPWDPEALPDLDESRTVTRADTVASVVLSVLVAAAIVWQQTSSPVEGAGGDAVPVLDPALWSGWIPALLVVLALDVVVALAVFRAGRWTRRLAVTQAVLDLAFALPLLVLLQRDQLFDPRFLDALVAGGWAEASRDLTATMTAGVLVVLGWQLVDAVRRVRAALG